MLEYMKNTFDAKRIDLFNYWPIIGFNHINTHHLLRAWILKLNTFEGQSFRI